ncbi:HlyD family secretion protein [Maridesulfovibrio bastinii]|uniref:HlyD family secretion protein n=1 Tax=Maridesulfovibrio bastinii TaxID=47157 RepID=UPI00040D1FB7|nr:HlyD family secretion protein [Maridesulfovibrio bastinii]
MNTEEKKSGASKGGLLRGKKKVFLISIIAVLCCLGVAYPFYHHAMTHESTDDAFVEAHVVSISPHISGHLLKVEIKDNQYVKKGQLIAEIDPVDYSIAVEIARAGVKSVESSIKVSEARYLAAKNVLAQQEAELRSQVAELDDYKAQIAQYKASFDRDETDFKRMTKIVREGAVSRQEFDHAKAQQRESRAKFNSAKYKLNTQSAEIQKAGAAVKAAMGDVKRAEAQIEVQSANLKEAKARLDKALQNLSYTKIAAPTDGYITKKSIEAGDYVQVGQNLVSIVSPKVWVVANFKETQIEDIHPGQPVEIEIDTYPDRVFKGRVDSVQRGTGSRFTLLPPENAAGNFIKVVQRVPVKIVFEDSGNENMPLLAPGMSVIPNVDVSDVYEGDGTYTNVASSELPEK